MNANIKHPYIRFIYSSRSNSLIMAALRSRCGHYILQLWFLSILLPFFPSPILSGWRLDVYYTSTHDVALVQI